LRFTGGGGKLASGSSDHTIQIWDVANPDQDSIILQRHTGWVWDLDINPQGDRIVSSGSDRTVFVWKIDSAELSNNVCLTGSGRTISEAEWIRYVGSDFDYAEYYAPCSVANIATTAHSGGADAQ
jgi:WD40 repeat protein